MIEDFELHFSEREPEDYTARSNVWWSIALFIAMAAAAIGWAI